MNTIKELYSSPTTKILVVKIGGMLCTSDPNDYNVGGGGQYGDGDTNDNGDF